MPFYDWFFSFARWLVWLSAGFFKVLRLLQCTVNNFEIWHTCSARWCPTRASSEKAIDARGLVVLNKINTDRIAHLWLGIFWMITNSLTNVITNDYICGWPFALVDHCQPEKMKTMPMFAAPFNPLNVTFYYEFHTSHSLPHVCSYCIYCLIIIQLTMWQWTDKSALVYQW